MCENKLKEANIDYTNKETLKELFTLYEDEIYTNSEENSKFANKIVKAEKELYSELTQRQKELFEKVWELRILDFEETNKNIFIYSFKLAFKLFAECIF